MSDDPWVRIEEIWVINGYELGKIKVNPNACILYKGID